MFCKIFSYLPGGSDFADPIELAKNNTTPRSTNASDIVEEAKIKVLTNTWAVDTIVENDEVKGIIIENKSGRQAIMADIVIDATFDADIAARAGAPMDKLTAS